MDCETLAARATSLIVGRGVDAMVTAIIEIGKGAGVKLGEESQIPGCRKAPNTRLQIAENANVRREQKHATNQGPLHVARSEVWSFSGAWSLVFGVFWTLFCVTSGFGRGKGPI